MNVSQYTFEGECLDEDTITIIRQPRSNVEELLDALNDTMPLSEPVQWTEVRLTGEELAAALRGWDEAIFGDD